MDIRSLTPTISNRLQLIDFPRSTGYRLLQAWISRGKRDKGSDQQCPTRCSRTWKSIWNDLNAARGYLALLSCWSLRMEQQRNNDDERMQWKAWRQKGYVPTLKFASLWVKGLWDIRHLWHVRSWESLPWDIIWGSMRFPAMLWTLAVDVRESKKELIRSDKSKIWKLILCTEDGTRNWTKTTMNVSNSLICEAVSALLSLIKLWCLQKTPEI